MLAPRLACSLSHIPHTKHLPSPPTLLDRRGPAVLYDAPRAGAPAEGGGGEEKGGARGPRPRRRLVRGRLCGRGRIHGRPVSLLWHSCARNATYSTAPLDRASEDRVHVIEVSEISIGKATIAPVWPAAVDLVAHRNLRDSVRRASGPTSSIGPCSSRYTGF